MTYKTLQNIDFFLTFYNININIFLNKIHNGIMNNMIMII